MNELPNGWAVVPVSSVAEVNPANTSLPIPEDGLVSFVRMASVEVESGILDATLVRPWREVSKGYTRFQEGDVLFAKITPCMENGKIAIAKGLHGQVGAGSTEFHVLRTTAAVRHKYLLHFLLQRQVRRGARMIMQGAAGQLRVPASFFGRLDLPLAPTEEQDRIVAEIEKQFTRLDAATAALMRVRANLKRYRASVLKAACEGRLVPTEAELARMEGRDYEPADKLLQRILRERRARWEADMLATMQTSGKSHQDDRWRQRYKEPSAPDTGNLPELPEGWCWASLDQLFFVERGRFSIRPRNDPRYYGGSYPFVQIGDLPREGGLIQEYKQTLNEKGLAVSKMFRAGTILIAIVGATIGISGILSFDSCCPDSLVALRGDRPATLLFAEYFLRLRKLEIRNTSYASGGQPNINLAFLLPYPIPLPPEAEQKRIIDELDRVLSSVDAMEPMLAKEHARSVRLRQSILARAFTGHLVAQDPTDEPAAALLERIHAERGKSASQRPARRSRREPAHA